MTISYPLAFPTAIRAAGIVPALNFAVASSQSPFTGEQQVFKWPGEFWTFDYTLPPYADRATAEEWLAFAHKLRGNYGTFLLGDMSAETPRGLGTGSPQVDGGSQTGYTLNIKNLSPSLTGWLLKGDYFQSGSAGNSRLHKLTEDANTDGSGKATLEFVPQLRFSPLDGDALVISAAKGVFRMADSAITWNIDANRHYRFGFKAVEALS